MTNDQSPANGSTPDSIRSIVADALRFWEKGRLFYNAVLFVVVVTYFLAGLPASRHAIHVNWLLLLVLMAVAANVLYCLAYVADVFVRLAGLRRAWARGRWVLLLVGTAAAAAITRFVAIGVFILGQRH